jgi:SAM-dependent methyltransferase
MNKNKKLFDDQLYGGWEKKYREQAGDAEAWSSEPQPWILERVKCIHQSGRKPAVVADLGCGDGRNTKVLVNAGHLVIAVDISPTGLDLLLRRFDSVAGLSPVAVVGNLEELPLASNQFDAVLCADALPQVQRPRRAIEEIHRILKSGAPAIVNVFTKKDCAFGEGQMISPNQFVYLNTLFTFYDESDMSVLCQGLFNIESVDHVNWEDPPHVPFRPHRHQHDAFVYILRKP